MMAKLRFLLGTFFIVVSTWLSGPADGGESVLPPPGTILSETKRDLGQGYFDVKRSQVNPPGHWEGIGHFGFVFYREQKLCQCGEAEVSISPQGEFAVFVDEKSGALTLFHAATGSRQRLSEAYIGRPHSSDWQLSHRRVIVTLEKYDNDRRSTSKLTIPLGTHYAEP